jgi:mannose-6-phosphate isomerase-like protein (cupin superfamily)
MVWKVRRVYTGHDARGRSIIVEDGIARNVKEMASMPGLALTDLWETGGPLASNAGNADAAKRPVHLEPPKGGTILRIVEFPPDKAWRDNADAMAAFESIGAGHAKDAGSSDPMMHKTATVDYIIVIKGEMHAIVDTGEVLLRPGDVFIQRGTNHSWSVRGDEPCIIAAILVSATPVGAAPKKRSGGAAKKRADVKRAGLKRAAKSPAAGRKTPAKRAAKKSAAKKATGRTRRAAKR